MKNRLKALRSALKITQFELADKAKIGRSTYAMFETGQRVPKDIHISSICTVTGANEEWLKTGNGDMFAASADDTIAAVCEKHNFSTIEKKMLETYVALEPKYREGVLQYVENLVMSVIDDNSAYQDMLQARANAENEAIRNALSDALEVKDADNESEAHA